VEVSAVSIIAKSGLYVKKTKHKMWSMVPMFVGCELCLLRIERVYGSKNKKNNITGSMTYSRSLHLPFR